MRYFKSSSGAVFGYDAGQSHLASQAIANGWQEVTGNWPPAKTQAEIDAEQNAKAKARLVEIDIASTRSIREWLAARPDAPQFIKNHEAAAIAERAKVKP